MLLETLRISADRQRLVAVGLGVVDLAVGDLQHRRDVELGVRGDDAVLERAGDRDRLERRARLVVEADGLVLVWRTPAPPPGSLALTRGQLASARIAPVLGFIDDRRRALGRVLRADPGEHLLDLVLQRGVDRQLQRLAGLHRAHVVDRDRLADRVVDDPPHPVGARAARGCSGTRGRSRPGRRACDGAEHLRGGPVARIDARDLRDQRDPVDLQLGMIVRRLVGREQVAPAARSRCAGLVSAVSTVSTGLPQQRRELLRPSPAGA